MIVATTLSASSPARCPKRFSRLVVFWPCRRVRGTLDPGNRLFPAWTPPINVGTLLTAVSPRIAPAPRARKDTHEAHVRFRDAARRARSRRRARLELCLGRHLVRSQDFEPHRRRRAGDRRPPEWLRKPQLSRWPRDGNEQDLRDLLDPVRLLGRIRLHVDDQPVLGRRR